MAFEKAKVLKAAEKFLSQGKINAAIKEYRQIIKHDRDDLTARQHAGRSAGARRAKKMKRFPASCASPNIIANRNSG